MNKRKFVFVFKKGVDYFAGVILVANDLDANPSLTLAQILTLYLYHLIVKPQRSPVTHIV